MNEWAQRLLEYRQQGCDVIDLTQSNPLQSGIAFPDVEYADLHLKSVLNDYHPNPRGMLSARRALVTSNVFRGVPVDSEQLLLCASTSEAYAWLFQLFCDPGSSVLVPSPSYPLFSDLAGLAGVSLVQYRLEYDARGWHVNRASLPMAEEHAIRALVVVHPNNPTGSYLRRSEMEFLLDWCAQRDIPLIADEVFFDYAIDPREKIGSFSEVAVQRGALCFVLSGLSKMFGLPQAKLGWIHIVGPEPLRTQSQNHLEWIADTFLSVSAFPQQCLPWILPQRVARQKAILDRVRQNHSALVRMTEETPCTLLRTEGGWSAVLRLPATVSSEAWALDFLVQDQVLVHPGSFFDFPAGCVVVISLLPPFEVFAQGIQRIVQRVFHHTVHSHLSINNP